MKKVLFVLFLCGIFSSSSFAQIQVGVRGGLNVSNIVGKYYSGFDFLAGAHGGVFMRFNAKEKAYFQPELLFSMKGNTLRDQFSGGKYVNSLRLNYLDIPLMAGLKPFNGFTILLGVQPSVLLNASSITRYAGKRTTNSVKNGVTSFDLAPIGGIQFESRSGFDFGIRASYGIVDVFSSSSSFNRHNLNFMATVGYAFGK